MLKKGILALAVMACTVFGASAETILYVPQDDRPVSLSYTVSTAKDAGYTVLTPPKELISGKNFHGEADQIWKWLDLHKDEADIMVISTDTLVYGGLVDSRKHNIPLNVLMRRLKKLSELKGARNIPVYGFGTVMRSPRASGGGVEPAYYSEYGPKVFRISALQDKKDAQGLTDSESAELFNLISEVPVEYLQDWFARRHINMKINEALIELVRNHSFTYFALGHDDTSYLSQSDLESRYLKAFSKGLSYREYGSFPGADQLGLLLIARAHVDKNHLNPTFNVIYPLGGAEMTIPHYEDQPVGVTISQHIEAVGGNEIKGQKAEYLLAVNTPLSKETGEAGYFNNLPMASKSVQHFVDRMKAAMREGMIVGVADISYSNGASNLLTSALQKNNMLYKIGAYDGWNTASNTIGYAIAQVVLSKDMTKQKHQDMLTQQYLDNWAYQANIRKDIYRMQEILKLGNVKYVGGMSDKMLETLREEMQQFAKRELGINPQTVTADFPWDRLFETDVKVYDKPIVPDYRAERIAREKAAEEARLKAEAEKKAKDAEKQKVLDSKYPENAAPHGVVKQDDEVKNDVDKTSEQSDKPIKSKGEVVVTKEQ